MNTKPVISICIPAYKRIDFLTRLLDSVAEQSYKSFEVIVSDDSPGNEVESLCEKYKTKFLLVYHKNPQPLGTPENWNQAIRMAKGEWIKLMHDDDWFSKPDSLEKFVKAANDSNAGFVFSSYNDVFFKTGKQKRVFLPAFRYKIFKKEPVSLLSRNIIGPPSVVMHRNDGKHWYDPKLKWLVDVDMYVRRLEKENHCYVPEPLINVGISAEQVTASVHGAPEVEVPEHFYFLEKTDTSRLKNILVYDYWWRFIRNFRLFSMDDVGKHGWNAPIHPVIQQMMKWQKKIPAAIIKRGVFSKLLMFIHFSLYRSKL